MRPLPWTIRVSLFAIGFGLGLSHYTPSTPPRPIVLEIHLPIPHSKISESLTSNAALPCEDPLPLEKVSDQTERTRL